MVLATARQRAGAAEYSECDAKRRESYLEYSGGGIAYSDSTFPVCGLIRNHLSFALAEGQTERNATRMLRDGAPLPLIVAGCGRLSAEIQARIGRGLASESESAQATNTARLC
jgi:hypothetical protein